MSFTTIGIVSDGDELGKGENNGNVGGLTDINTRTDLTNRNTYNDSNGYSLVHQNALSDGDELGKGGINFDHSDSASAIYRNNTLYFNGVHNIIQMQEHGELLHVGNNKVAGIKANGVLYN